GVLRGHSERGLAFVFREFRRSCCSRRLIDQLAVSKRELAHGRRAIGGRSFVASVRRDDHRRTFVSLLSRDPAPPAPGELFDIGYLLFAGNATERGQGEHSRKK